MPERMKGSSVAMRDLRSRITKVARSTLPSILILGESGTGKELAARALHESSARAGRPYVAWDCGTLTETLVESELFGHKKGSFTGATDDRDGVFVQADTGTLFLDELGNLSETNQRKILRVIEQQEVTPVGGQRPVKIDVRVIGATNADLQARILEGTFRLDLEQRFAYTLKLPRLSDRDEDVVELAQHFLQEQRPGAVLSDEACVLLKNYDFPGNVRELKKLIGALEVDHEDVRVVRPEHILLPSGGMSPVRTEDKRSLEQQAQDAIAGLVYEGLLAREVVLDGLAPESDGLSGVVRCFVEGVIEGMRLFMADESGRAVLRSGVGLARQQLGLNKKDSGKARPWLKHLHSGLVRAIEEDRQDRPAHLD